MKGSIFSHFFWYFFIQTIIKTNIYIYSKIYEEWGYALFFISREGSHLATIAWALQIGWLASSYRRSLVSKRSYLGVVCLVSVSLKFVPGLQDQYYYYFDHKNAIHHAHSYYFLDHYPNCSSHGWRSGSLDRDGDYECLWLSWQGQWLHCSCLICWLESSEHLLNCHFY